MILILSILESLFLFFEDCFKIEKNIANFES